MPRTIIHLDLDAFFCAVEELHDPTLRGKAFAVGGSPRSRGVVCSCSYPARQYGVRSAMPMSRAVGMCPQLLVVTPHFPWYREASHEVMAHLHEITPLVEQISIDEAFLDITDTGSDGESAARRLQQDIRDELGLPCSLGVATNKLLAKVATDQGKERVRSGKMPSAVCVVAPGEEAEFLAPLPVRALWGVGPKTGERLTLLGMHTIGDIASRPCPELVRHFGRGGEDMWRHAWGIDNRPLVTSRLSKSISKETTFERDVDDYMELRHIAEELAQGVARQLQREELTGHTVKLKLRWSDFTTLTRQVRLARRTDRHEIIAPAATNLLSQLWKTPRAVRLIGVGVTGLDENRQLSLWGADENFEIAERRQMAD